MSNTITNVSPNVNEVATEVVPAIASVICSGVTLAERKKSVINGGLTEASAMMLAGLKGKEGQMLRERLVDAGVAKAIKMAINGRYIALVEVFAAKTGQSLTISNAEEFNAMPYVLANLIVAERAKGKTNGTKVDSKTGLTIDNPKVAALMELQALMTEAVNEAKQAAKDRQAAKEAKLKLEQAAN